MAALPSAQRFNRTRVWWEKKPKRNTAIAAVLYITTRTLGRGVQAHVLAMNAKVWGWEGKVERQYGWKGEPRVVGIVTTRCTAKSTFS